MAGIDNNTLLYLRGDSFNDLSLNPKTITNIGDVVVVNDNELLFGKNKYLTTSQHSDFTIGEGDFTIETYVYINKDATNSNDIFTTNKYYRDFYFAIHPVNGTVYLRIDIASKDTIYSTIPMPLGEWVHIAGVRYNGVVTLYINGINAGSKDIPGEITMNAPTIGCHNNYIGQDYINGSIKELRFSNVARYINDFTPPAKPYNSLSINVTEKDLNKVDFNVTKIGQEVINKVEVVKNDEVIETFTDVYNNLSFNPDGDDFKVVVTYDDMYTEELDIKFTYNKAKIWLYKEGNECSSVTGGWDFKVLYNYTSYETSKNDGVLHAKVLSGNNAGGTTKLNIYTKNLIDIQYFGDIVYDIEGFIDSSTYARLSCYMSKTYGNLGTGGGISNGTGFGTIPNSIDGRTYVTVPTDIDNGSYYCCVYIDADGNSTKPSHYVNVYNIYSFLDVDVINIQSQDVTSINFKLNNFDNLITFTQVDILVNGRVIQTYTENLDSITYEFDESLMNPGNNMISIQATYTQGDGIYEVAELTSNKPYFKPIEEFDRIIGLPATANLRDLIDRLDVVKTINYSIISQMKMMLESKGYVVGDNPRLSTLVKMFSQLSTDNSTEITDYLNRIFALENEVEELDDKILGYENNLRIMLNDEGVSVTEEDDMTSLISKVDEEFNDKENEISNIKQDLVDALANKGIDADVGDSFDNLINNIGDIGGQIITITQTELKTSYSKSWVKHTINTGLNAIPKAIIVNGVGYLYIPNSTYSTYPTENLTIANSLLNYSESTAMEFKYFYISSRPATLVQTDNSVKFYITDITENSFSFYMAVLYNGSGTDNGSRNLYTNTLTIYLII